jgi:hypothetical protein
MGIESTLFKKQLRNFFNPTVNFLRFHPLSYIIIHLEKRHTSYTEYFKVPFVTLSDCANLSSDRIKSLTRTYLTFITFSGHFSLGLIPERRSCG